MMRPEITIKAEPSPRFQRPHKDSGGCREHRMTAIGQITPGGYHSKTYTIFFPGWGGEWWRDSVLQNSSQVTSLLRLSMAFFAEIVSGLVGYLP